MKRTTRFFVLFCSSITITIIIINNNKTHDDACMMRDLAVSFLIGCLPPLPAKIHKHCFFPERFFLQKNFL
jgi:hypothetical protein